MLETDYSTNIDEIIKERKLIRNVSNHNSLTLILFLILSQLLAMGISWFFSLFKDIMIEEYYVAISDYIGYFFVYFVVVPISVLIINKKNNFKLRNFFSKPSMTKGDIFKWVLIGYSITMIVNIVFNTLFALIESFGVKMEVPQMPSSDSWLSVVFSFLFVAFLGPISEELIFRGSILGNTAKCGEWFAIVMSGVFFGLTHANYQQIFFATAMGIISGYVTIRAHSIIPAVIMHIGTNLISTIQMNLISRVDSRFFEANLSNRALQELFIDNIGYLIPVFLLSFLSFAISFAGLVLFIIEIINIKKKPKLNNNCNKVSAVDKTFIYITAPCTVSLIILILFLTAMNLVG